MALLARGETLRRLKETGLRVFHSDFEFEETIPAYSQEELREKISPSSVRIVFLVTKSDATPSVASFLKEWIGDTPSTKSPLVVSIQNGVDNEPILVDALGLERVAGGLAVRIGSHADEMGTIHAVGEARIEFGEWPEETGKRSDHYYEQLHWLEEVLPLAGIPVTRSRTILKDLWRKLMINNGVNPLTALTGQKTGPIMHDAGLSEIVYQMMVEVLEAAKQDSVPMDRSDVDEMFALIKSFDSIKTSMQIDVEKGRTPELSAITGTILRRIGPDMGYCTAFIESLLVQKLKHLQIPYDSDHEIADPQNAFKILETGHRENVGLLKAARKLLTALQ